MRVGDGVGDGCVGFLGFDVEISISERVFVGEGVFRLRYLSFEYRSLALDCMYLSPEKGRRD